MSCSIRVGFSKKGKPTFSITSGNVTVTKRANGTNKVSIKVPLGSKASDGNIILTGFNQ